MPAIFHPPSNTDMSVRLKDPNDPKAVALFNLIQRLYAEEAQKSKDPKNKTEMKTTDGKILRFTEPD